MFDITLKFDPKCGWVWKWENPRFGNPKIWHFGYLSQQHARQDIALQFPFAFVQTIGDI